MGLLVNPYSLAPSFTGLLDTYSGAAAAYSLRKLRGAYSGAAARVRRSSDNTEQNIGFDLNGNLDEAALTAFVGSGNGYVTTWYDQSGNARNMVQETTTSQPRIVNSGTIDKVNNKVALFSSSSSWLYSYSLAANLAGNNPSLSAFGVVKVDNNGRQDYIFEITAEYGNPEYAQWVCGHNYTTFYSFVFDEVGTLNLQDYSGIPINAQKNLSVTYDGSELTIYYGSLYNYNIVSGMGYLDLQIAQIGRRYGTGLEGSFQEMIFYKSSQVSNRSGISSNQTTYFGI